MKYLINKSWNIAYQYNIDNLLYLLIDRPDIIWHGDKDFTWTDENGVWDREYDLPAYSNSTSTEVSWYKKMVLLYKIK